MLNTSKDTLDDNPKILDRTRTQIEVPELADTSFYINAWKNDTSGIISPSSNVDFLQKPRCSGGVDSAVGTKEEEQLLVR